MYKDSEMVLDGNRQEKESLAAFRAGDEETGHRLQDDFLAKIHAAFDGHDHCSCEVKGCKFHGNCLDCVTIHRGHRDHLPNCFSSMVNERIAVISALTEDTYAKTLDK